jgi:hypothetical protein
MINKKGKIDISLIVGILLLIAIVIGTLEIVGLINIRALFGGPGTFIPTNYEEKIKEMCKKTDSEGIYNKENANKIENGFLELYKDPLFETGTPDDMDKMVEKIWDVVKESNYCENNECNLATDDGTKNLYRYNCSTQKLEKNNLEETAGEFVSDYYLSLGCSKMDKNGTFENKNVKCGNYHCSSTYKGKTYKRNCKSENN